MKHASVLSALAVLAVAAALAGCGTAQKSTDPADQVGHAGHTAPGAAFVGKENQVVAGGYRLTLDGDHHHLELTDDFKSDPGPDLHVILSPVPPEDATGANAMADGQAVIVGKLRSLNGRQVYDVPTGTELSDFNSVLIHCVKYSHLYGAAELK